MRFKSERSSLTKGDLLIFTHQSGVLTGDIGDVVTFAGWYNAEIARHSSFYKMFPQRLGEDFEPNNYLYQTAFQCEELMENSPGHNLPIACVEKFNPATHKEYRKLTKAIIEDQVRDFIQKFGA